MQATASIRCDEYCSGNRRLTQQLTACNGISETSGGSGLTRLLMSRSITFSVKINWLAARVGGIPRLELNEEEKRIVQELGDAINAAIGGSGQVAEAIARLRGAGYEMNLTLKLEIGLRRLPDSEEPENGSAVLELTDEDRRTLRSMRIRFDDND